MGEAVLSHCDCAVHQPSPLFIEVGIERDVGGFEVCLFDECSRFCGTVFAIHPAVFPLNGEGTLVADIIQRSDDLLEVHTAMPQRTEVPEAFWIAEAGMAAKNADAFGG